MPSVLIFSCISAVMLMTAAYGATISPEKVCLLTTLIKDLQNLEKSKDNIYLELYTPNEKKECTRQTLQCYLTEMDTLEKELEDEHVDDVQNIKKNLQRLMDLTPGESRCKICEANKKKEFPEFHRELKSFLTSMLK